MGSELYGGINEFLSVSLISHLFFSVCAAMLLRLSAHEFSFSFFF